ncbi:hypothetical protein RU639_010520 [Aspergillus parasiticus]
MLIVSLPSLVAALLLATSVTAKTALLHSQRGCHGDSSVIPWSQCIPTHGNKSIDVPISDKPDQVLFDCYLYSMESDTTCQEDRRKPSTGCTDNLYYYSKCVFVPAPGFVSLYQYSHFDGKSVKINITDTEECKPLSLLPSQVGSIVVGEGHSCDVWWDDHCLSKLVTITSPGNGDIDLSLARSMNCSEKAISSEEIHYDL